jgi:hypothetical protein
MRELSEDDRYMLQVCSAIITNNVAQSQALLKSPQAVQLPASLRAELSQVATPRAPSRVDALVRATYYLPAWVQYVGQRVVLLSPRMAHWLLRKTRLHHRWY